METVHEEWREVPSVREVEASSLGRIRRKPHFTKGRWYISAPTYGVERRASKNAKHRYMGYYYKGIGNLKVHRLVAEAFLGPRPSEQAVVIHLNEDSKDNMITNLKWGTQKENLNAPGFIEYCRSRTGENNPRVKGRRKAVD